MATFKNMSPGPRGITKKDGSTVWIEPGQSIDVDDKDVAGELPDLGGASEAAVSAAPVEPGPLDGSVEDLTAHVATMTDADAVQALIDAETAGKSRKGAMAVLEARRDELLAA